MKKLFVLFLSIFLSISVSSQSWNIDDVNGQTITTCGGTFYDSGGPTGNYADGENYSVTFCSTTGVISINFSSIVLAKNDKLYIYDGATLISTITMGSWTGTFTSSCGCLRFVFESGNPNVAAGWVGTISCNYSNDYAVNAISPPLDGTCLTGQSNIGSTPDYNVGCFTSGNTVWYYIDLTGGANTLDVTLQNATFANVEYVLMYDYVCDPFSGTSVGAYCVSSGTTQQWADLTEGIYWLGVSSTIEGTFDLCITQSYVDVCGDFFCGSGESCLTCTFDCGACSEAEGGPYYHPSERVQGTFAGQCMVTTCSGTYYDNGGPGVNYANGIYQVYRTFCPEIPGTAISVTFTELGIASGDWLTVENGPTQNSPTIWQGRGTLPTPTTLSGVWSNPIVSTHRSGCLTFRFNSDAITNGPGWTANLSCVPHPLGTGPTDTYNNDCARAIAICDDVTIQSEVWGPGLNSEGCGSCVMSENWTEWYWVKVQTGGTMQFEVTPQGNSDMDFAIYRASLCNTLGAPVRCSYASYVSPGKTGLSMMAGDLSEDKTGDQWVAELNITAGEIYYIMINEWNKVNPNAYNIDFVLTNGASFDCTITLPVELLEFDAICNKDNIKIEWITASEINNDHFNIERSIDAKNWTNIGIVNGSGNSNTVKNYNWIDNNPIKGISYYRLKQTDYDGRYKYYDPVAVDCDVSSNAIYTPNPFNQDLTIDINNYETSDNYHIIIYNMLGKSVFETKITNKKTTLDLNNLLEGVYTIYLMQNSNIFSNKIIKL